MGPMVCPAATATTTTNDIQIAEALLIKENKPTINSQNEFSKRTLSNNILKHINVHDTEYVIIIRSNQP